MVTGIIPSTGVGANSKRLLIVPGHNASRLLFVTAYAHVDVVEALLEKLSVNANASDAHSNSSLHVHLASMFTCSDVAKIFIKFPNVKHNLVNNNGRTPLCEALLYGRVNIVQMVIGVENVNIVQMLIGIRTSK